MSLYPLGTHNEDRSSEVDTHRRLNTIGTFRLTVLKVVVYERLTIVILQAKLWYFGRDWLLGGGGHLRVVVA